MCVNLVHTLVYDLSTRNEMHTCVWRACAHDYAHGHAHGYAHGYAHASQESAYFFSDTKRGRSYCCTSFAIFAALCVALIAYELFWTLGYSNAPPFGIFYC